MKPCNKVYILKDKNTGQVVYSVDTNRELVLEVEEHDL